MRGRKGSQIGPGSIVELEAGVLPSTFPFHHGHHGRLQRGGVAGCRSARQLPSSRTQRGQGRPQYMRWRSDCYIARPVLSLDVDWHAKRRSIGKRTSLLLGLFRLPGRHLCNLLVDLLADAKTSRAVSRSLRRAASSRHCVTHDSAREEIPHFLVLAESSRKYMRCALRGAIG